MTLTETPLDSSHYTKLRKGHRTKWMVVKNPNTVVMAGQINQAAFATSFAQFTYDGVTVGAYTLAKEGWTLFVSHTNDINASYFRGRVRKPPTPTVMYLNQNSAPFADNDYFFVVMDTGLHEKLPRKAGDTLFLDWDKPYSQLDPSITNLPSFIVQRLSGSFVDVPLSSVTRANTSGATISGHEWDLDGGGSIIDGDVNSPAITVRYDTPGWYEVRDNVTDSAGRTNYFVVKVIIYPADYSAVITKSLVCDSLTCELSVGWSAQIRANADDDLVNVLDQTELVIFSEDWFNNERGSLITNAKFIGRIRGGNSSTSLGIQDGMVQITKQSQVEVEGIGAQLGRMILASVTLRRKNPATVLGELVNLTLWRGMQFLASLTTLPTIHALDFDSTNDDYQYPLFTAQDRSAESALSDVAFTINGFFNWSPSGQIKIARHIWYLNSTDKAGLTTIAAFDKRDYGGLTIQRDRVPRLGRVIGYGGTYNSSSGTTLALRAKAPAVVWGTGEGRSQLNRQVLKANLSLDAAKTEIAVRTGAEFTSKNLVNKLEIEHPSGYDNALSPSSYQRYTWEIAANSNREGFACGTSKYWWLERVQIRYTPLKDQEGGRTRTTASYVEDIEAVNAQIIAEIAPEDRPAAVPSLPQIFSTPILGLPSLPYPTGTAVDPDDEQPYTEKDAEATQKPPEKSTDPEQPTPTPEQHKPSKAGNVVAVANSGGLWICEDFALKANPGWKNITPGSGLTDFRFDPFSGGAYALTNDGTNSVLWRCPNVLNASWQGTSVAGVYTQVRVFGGAGGVAIYSPGTQSIGGQQAFDFLGSDEGWALTRGTSTASGLKTEFPSPEWNGFNFFFRLIADFTLPEPVTMTRVEVTHTVNATFGNFLEVHGREEAGDLSYVQMITYAGEGPSVESSGDGPWTNIGHITIAGHYVQSFQTDEPFYIESLRLYWETEFGEVVAAVRFSTDYGASMGTPLEAGLPAEPEAGFGADMSLVFAPVEDKVRDSSGGEFSDTAGGDTTGTYARGLWPYAGGLLLAPGAALGGETLFIVNGAATAITPNDGSAGTVIDRNGLATSPEGDAILFLGNFGGTVKLARSSDGSSWDFSAVDAAAKAVRAKNAQQVFVANGASVLYSEDGGATLVSKASPGASLILIEVR